MKIIKRNGAEVEFDRIKIKKAIEITKSGIERLMTEARVGMKEYELEAYFDFNA